MKRPLGISSSKIRVYIVLALLLGLVAQSCGSSKACGCKGDLNSVYKPKKRYR